MTLARAPMQGTERQVPSPFRLPLGPGGSSRPSLHRVWSLFPGPQQGASSPGLLFASEFHAGIRLLALLVPLPELPAHLHTVGALGDCPERDRQPAGVSGAGSSLWVPEPVLTFAGPLKHPAELAEAEQGSVSHQVRGVAGSLLGVLPSPTPISHRLFSLEPEGTVDPR